MTDNLKPPRGCAARLVVAVRVDRYDPFVAHNSGRKLTAAALFAGIGGVEAGLARSGIETVCMVENWDPARAVLSHRFPHADLLGDVAAVGSLPKVDIVTAGFPCTDLSQAGRTRGIAGSASGLVSHVFRLLPQADPTWLVLENVRNMLVLDRGRAMRYLVRELEDRGYRWAYRLIDSRSMGVPQRRQRVVLVASRDEDPCAVLFADEARVRADAEYGSTAYGFYWTEGLTGVGWAKDAVPTLKGGSGVGIPSAPAIWIPDAPIGRRIVTPTIEDAEALQGFRRGWTRAAAQSGRRNGPRWKLVGNAVTTGVSRWLGSRLMAPGEPVLAGRMRLGEDGRWPVAASGGDGRAWAASLNMWPVRRRYRHLLDVVDPVKAVPLSGRATAGFLKRAERSSLRFDPDFLVAMKEHLRTLSGEA